MKLTSNQRSLIFLALASSATAFTPVSQHYALNNNARTLRQSSQALFMSAATNITTDDATIFSESMTTNADGSRNKYELWKVEKIDRVFDDPDRPMYPNPLSLKPNTPLTWFVDEDDAVAAKVNVEAHDTQDDLEQGIKAEAFTLAGPRLDIAFDPQQCKAAVVTCGGLCPGLNTVVREIVMCLRRQYGVPTTFGIPSGYRGFQAPDSWIDLDEKAVRNFHNMGGSFLGSSRGGHDTKAIVDALEKEGINLLFVTGGDGTVRGAAKVAQEVKERGLEIAVAVIPKTIDNDIPFIDRTFGFETAVNAAREAIDVATTEAEGFPLGLGVVKVMGRHSGFIAMHSTLGSRVVDLCLVPEVDFFLDGEGGIVDHLADRLLENGHAVVVVAEGAGQELMEAMGAAGEEVIDASGNKLLDDVGPWLVSQIKPRLNRGSQRTEREDFNSVSWVS